MILSTIDSAGKVVLGRLYEFAACRVDLNFKLQISNISLYHGFYLGRVRHLISELKRFLGVAHSGAGYNPTRMY